MTSEPKQPTTKRCPVCHGRGWIPCECWPGDCICGWGYEECEDCDGSGIAGYRYDYGEDWE